MLAFCFSCRCLYRGLRNQGSPPSGNRWMKGKWNGRRLTKVKNLMEIRWHGRGGQGAVTAGRLLAEAALARGSYGQAFPEFGPERRGSPVQAFTRLSSSVIRAYYGIANPDVVIVLDPTLMEAVDVTQGLASDGLLLVNTRLSPGQVREKLKLGGATVGTVDASRIAQECMGVAIPNTAMIGALVRVRDILGLEDVTSYYRRAFASKYPAHVLDGNLNAIQRAHQEVRAE